MARELPIHNGRMTTDLDANGFKIKNLPPGSGFTQAQADWSQSDATAPDFIKNKPTIPAAVTIDATLTTPGAAADAKAVGDALRGGFTEWVCDEISDGWTFVSCEWDAVSEIGTGWFATLGNGSITISAFLGGNADSVNLEKEAQGHNPGVELSRHLITPTKTSQLTNDGDGTNAFVKTNDTRLSDARTPMAHTHAMADVTGLNAALSQKANATDLPYRLVEPGKWEFSGLPSGVSLVFAAYAENLEEWIFTFTDGVDEFDMNVSGSETETGLSFYVSGNPVTATRTLPGHLLDRAGNRVVVSGDTTLTLPAALSGGRLRDFLVRLEISGSTVPTITFAASGDESLTYETDGDEFPVPDEAGTWLYAFTETDASKFAVSLKKVNVVAQGGS